MFSGPTLHHGWWCNALVNVELIACIVQVFRNENLHKASQTYTLRASAVASRLDLAVGILFQLVGPIGKIRV